MDIDATLPAHIPTALKWFFLAHTLQSALAFIGSSPDGPAFEAHIPATTILQVLREARSDEDLRVAKLSAEAVDLAGQAPPGGAAVISTLPPLGQPQLPLGLNTSTPMMVAEAARQRKAIDDNTALRLLEQAKAQQAANDTRLAASVALGVTSADELLKLHERQQELDAQLAAAQQQPSTGRGAPCTTCTIRHSGSSGAIMAGTAIPYVTIGNFCFKCGKQGRPAAAAPLQLPAAVNTLPPGYLTPGTTGTVSSSPFDLTGVGTLPHRPPQHELEQRQAQELHQQRVQQLRLQQQAIHAGVQLREREQLQQAEEQKQRRADHLAHCLRLDQQAASPAASPAVSFRLQSNDDLVALALQAEEVQRSGGVGTPAGVAISADAQRQLELSAELERRGMTGLSLKEGRQLVTYGQTTMAEELLRVETQRRIAQYSNGDTKSDINGMVGVNIATVSAKVLRKAILLLSSEKKVPASATPGDIYQQQFSAGVVELSQKVTCKITQSLKRLGLNTLSNSPKLIQFMLEGKWAGIFPGYFLQDGEDQDAAADAIFNGASARQAAIPIPDVTNVVTLTRWLHQMCTIASCYDDPVETPKGWSKLIAIITTEGQKNKWTLVECRRVIVAALTDHADKLLNWCNRSDDSPRPSVGEWGFNHATAVTKCMDAASRRPHDKSDPLYTGQDIPTSPPTKLATTGPPERSEALVHAGNLPPRPPSGSGRSSSPAPSSGNLHNLKKHKANQPPQPPVSPNIWRSFLLPQQRMVKDKYACNFFVMNLKCPAGVGCRFLCWGTKGQARWLPGGAFLVSAMSD
jgi:hypothetical protein